MYIRRYASQNENFENGYPNAFLQFRLKLVRCKPHNAARHPTKFDVINDVKQFPTVYPGYTSRIYCGKFLTLCNQMSRYNASALELFLFVKCQLTTLQSFQDFTWV